MSTIMEVKWNSKDLAKVMAMLSLQDDYKSHLRPKTDLAEALAAKKKTGDPDQPMYHEAMVSDQADEWRRAMDEEIINLVKRKTWELVPRSEAKSPIIPGTWAFKCKRKPDGSFRKFKARFCVRGDVQKTKSGVDLDTYSPVVQWSTVRLMLFMSGKMNLVTQ